MKAISRHTVLLVASTSLVLTACASETSGAGGSGPGPDDNAALAFGDLDGRTFVSTQVTRDGKPDRLPSNAPIQLGFDGSTLSANAGCNSLFGEGRLDGDLLVIGGMGGTDMGCEPALMKQDEWLAKSLTAQPTVELDGDELTVSSGATTIELLDDEAANPDLALTGTRWVLEAFGDRAGDDGIVSSVPAGRPATLRITGARLSFSDSVNRGTARVVVRDSKLVITRTTRTLAGCDDSCEALQMAIADVLKGGAVAYSIDGDQLVLTKGDTALTYRAR
ncbi:MAG: META domain-containing protein [Nocardioidaceae bacterium]|nr:META domain-containing protein [Nocardioidaceae bacterium]